MKMKKNLVMLVCFGLFIFACKKVVENETATQQIPNQTSDAVQIQEEQIQDEQVQDPNSFFQAGKLKFEQNDFQGAIADFTKSLEIIEKHHVRADLGRAKEAAGDLQGALEDYTKAIEQEKRGVYYQWRAKLYTKLGKTAEAAKDMAEYEKMPKE
jgi:tetratricopeptide (TPR) repeat protein